MLQPNQTYTLSRYVVLHADPDGLLVESPLSRDVLRVPNPAVLNLLLLLARGARPADLYEGRPDAQQALLERLLTKFESNGWLTAVDEEGEPEETHGALADWAFHDLFFHSRSRAGRNVDRMGAKSGLKLEEMPPTFKEIESSVRIALPSPDLDEVANRDLSFTEVLEARRSVREYADAPVSLDALGEFLYRSCRAKGYRDDSRVPLTRRPYPSGGSLYPLEVYVIPNRCEVLERGLYHYHPGRHDLNRLDAAPNHVETLLKDAQRAAGLDVLPPVLFCISARFRRTAWKYDSIAYALILKEAGALFQTMWLVATAMNLAPCGLGTGNSDVFAHAIGSEYYDETSVGEFVIGVRTMH
ncbi:MAG: SagB family peptide dehydrogenase [Bacteroidota bacterium]